MGRVRTDRGALRTGISGLGAEGTRGLAQNGPSLVKKTCVPGDVSDPRATDVKRAGLSHGGLILLTPDGLVRGAHRPETLGLLGTLRCTECGRGAAAYLWSAQATHEWDPGAASDL
ncbi:hypothetical protein NDU88_000548 [Pleurodeles waltl]|uniref:Uncharacterized protein n=1 Tax=Pleurodeles waltl TaxID=8319 RepID=A0AAV7MK14_PLEWA|nr:hypothetical protein NDU88_000548 [Pleurodeles waltl]